MRLTLILLLLAVPGTIQAQCSTPSRGRQTSYQRHDYQKTHVIVQPIVVPATVFQFLPAYFGGSVGLQTSGAAQSVAVAAGAAPTAVAAPAPVAMPGSVPLAAPQGAPRTLNLPAAQPPEGDAAAESVPQAQQQVQQQVQQGLAQQGISVMMSKCASCHTGAGSKGDFPIFREPGVLANLSLSQKQAILESVAQDNMPRPVIKGQPVIKCTPEEKLALQNLPVTSSP